MKKTVLTFGLIGGGIIAVMIFGTMPFVSKIGFDKGYIIGYTTMVLAFMMVFFGIRSYRENIGNGQITFGRALGVGMLIMLIICVFYVVTWEILYFNFMPDFLDRYAAYAVEKARAAGATQQAIDAQIQEMKKFKVLYDNPFINVAFTLIEPLPVGLVITLISALVLRKKAKPNQVEMDAPSTTMA